jgi:Glycosyl hydrolases family 2, sugar binding domain/Glycosyl hydrolases family 2, TIM barrel domain/Glycosyl hydrolases family 2
MTRTLLFACGFALLLPPARAADWQPAKAPLMTRWAADVKPDRVHPEYPRPQLVRSEWLNLNGLWQLAFAKEGEAAPVGKELSERILVPFPVESALSGVMKHADRLWYRRTFQVPAKWSGQRVLLHFGAVDWEATVWVNGKQIGSHQGGYDAFSFDITDALRPSGEQELIVGVGDPTNNGPQPRGKQVLEPRGIYYTPTTGIWQTVWLEPVPEASVAGLKIVPDVDGGKVVVTVLGRGNTEGSYLDVYVEGGGETSVAVPKFGAAHEFSLKLPKLWSPESPFLYDLTVRVMKDQKEVDVVKSYFGMRKITLGKDDKGVTRLFLNNKPLFQVGPLDQGFWPDGLYTAPTDEALKYDIEITKKLGFNMTRKHVKVEPARWYYWCDKLGLLVWQDMPSGDRSVRSGGGEMKRTPESARIYERELKAMLDGLHNHPSIIMWVVFNEGWGQFDTVRITDWTKKYDPSRLVDCASGWNDMKCGDVHDIHVYPGPGAPPTESSRAGVLGEFGGLGLPVDGHTWAQKTWGYRGTASSEDLTRKYERLLRAVYQLKEDQGLSAAVYTQITDVETEANGLLTYDRAVIKVNADRVAAANRGQFTNVPLVRVVVPASQGKGVTWRYTFEQPAGDWFKPDYDDKQWKQGPGGFGTKGTPGAHVRTEWKTPAIWLRREITLPERDLSHLQLLVHHDEDAEIYLNGVLAARLEGYITDYEEVPIREEARKALKPGKNVLAVSCKQTTGGQYIDVGLVEVK